MLIVSARPMHKEAATDLMRGTSIRPIRGIFRKADLLVVLSLIHLKEGHERMGDKLTDLRVQDGRLNSA